MYGHAVLDLVVALVILVGIVGAAIQVIPGLLLVGGAVLAWGIATGGALGWTVVVFAMLVMVAGTALKYAIAGRYLKAQGVPNVSILVGTGLGIVGFFVIPVVGLFIGFIGGTYLAELSRLKDNSQAWPSTVHAMKATGLSILVELGAALTLTAIWIAALVLH
jgi:uncharacterized protein YqgC (DUF456 family)